ncbi:MAG: GGDEF domain-containing protein [Desulfovibrio sp.]|jgi:diguanylate cyclase (GGDEF)-like protein|nr:GGDEF domain-containing protein [Desulfovibrio sp.]
MSSERVAADILKAMDMAVLQRTAPGEYRLTDTPPAFYDEMFPPDPDGPCNTPWRHSEMLRFFYESAEEFFTSGENGVISSGSWEEDDLCGHNQALTAEAVCYGDTQAVTVRLLTESYARRLEMLRKARTVLLEREKMQNDITRYKQKASTDGLTRLLNRAAFREQLEEKAACARETGKSLALVMIDVDNFKRINDSYGHQAGDQVLCALGNLLPANLRQEDLIGRYGGEEFILAVPGVSEEQILTVAEKLRKKTSETVVDPALPMFTISVGCALYRHGEDIDECIRRADMALYAAKHGGRNTVRML